MTVMRNFTLTPYKVIRKPRLKHLYLHIKRHEVIVTANKRVSQSTIEQFVLSKSHWIEKQLQREMAPTLTDPDAEIFLLGKSYKVVIEREMAEDGESMEIEGSNAVFFLSTEPNHDRLQSLRDDYYKKLCAATITPLVAEYAASMGLSPRKITYRHNRSRWGSCSSQNKLSLNTRLMMLPKSMITYVVIHELAHITHKNHSKAFWDLVGQYCPSYKLLRRGIRTFESRL
jgi:predicted metal-dependent hydrolase